MASGGAGDGAVVLSSLVFVVGWVAVAEGGL